MRRASTILVTILMAAVVIIAVSPLIQPKSSNPCSSCHGSYYMYLDILEGDAGNVLPTTLKDGQTLNVTAVVKVECNTGSYNTMTSITASLSSKNGHFKVSNGNSNIGSLKGGSTAKATWQITPVSAGNDSLVITASGKNSHQNVQFSDSYSPSPGITVDINNRPSISMTAPAAGERLTGGSVRTLKWNVTDEDAANCAVSIYYTTDAFVSVNKTIQSGIKGGQSLDWTLPSIDSTTATIKATVTDPGGLFNETVPTADFAIDSTAPAVSSVQPADGNDDAGKLSSVVIKFSEPVNRSTVALNISPDPGSLTWSWSADNSTVTGSHDAFVAGTRYNCTLSAGVKDRSTPGNTNQSSFKWWFAVNAAPSLTLNASVGERRTGGTSFLITWTARDEAPACCTVGLFYSTDGFKKSNVSIAAGLPGSGGHNWTLPAIDNSTVSVRAEVTDPKGLANVSEMDGSFAIDSTPPTVASAEPRGLDANLSASAFLTIRFSEPVNASSAQGAFSITPDPGSVKWSWSDDLTEMSATHGPFVANTTYNCSLAAGFLDLSIPGNAASKGYNWSFTTPAVIFERPIVQLMAPSDGTRLYSDQALEVRYMAAGGTGTLKLNVSLSVNGASGPFTAVASGLSNGGSFFIPAPLAVSDRCVLDISAYDEKGIETHVLSGVFAVAGAMSLAASFPTGPVTAGDAVNLTWDLTGGHGAVAVTLLFQPDAGSARQTVASGQPSPGNCRWTAPELNTSDARLIVNATDDWGGSVEKISAAFKIETKAVLPPPVQPPVEPPSGGDNDTDGTGGPSEPPADNNGTNGTNGTGNATGHGDGTGQQGDPGGGVVAGPDRAPIVKFDIKERRVRAQSLVTLDASASYDPDGAKLYYLWDFGDGTPSVNANTPIITHVYLDQGIFIIVLTVGDGQAETVQSMNIVVDSAPVTGGSVSAINSDTLLVYLGIMVVLMGLVGTAYAAARRPSNQVEGSKARQDDDVALMASPPREPDDPDGAEFTEAPALETVDPPEEGAPATGQAGLVAVSADADAPSTDGMATTLAQLPPESSEYGGRMAAPLIFDSEKCVGCGGCSRRCPRQAITMVGDRPELAPRKCTSCGVCVRKCARAAISPNPEFGPDGRQG